MKIIAKTKEGFLLEATEDEIANIFGKDSAWEMKNRVEGNSNFPEIGKSIPVSSLYKNSCDTLNSYSNIKREFNSIQKDIGKLLSLMLPDKEKK